MKSTKELLREYNSLTDKPIRVWSQSKEKLQQRIDALKPAKSVFKEQPKAAPKAETGDKKDEAVFQDFPVNGEKIGKFLQRLLLSNKYTTAELVAYGKEFFPTSKVSPSDIGWHRAFLKRSDTPAKLVRVKKDGTRYTV